MIHVVSSRNIAAYEIEMLEHYRIRHDIYVRERKWMALAKPDGLERDQFDTDDAIYVLAIDQGQVVGGSRLVPSLKPHLLSEVFPHLADGAVPRGPDILEWTRVHVVKARREGRNRGRVAGMVFCGILEYCLQSDVSALSALVEMWWLPHFQEMGWTIKPLGLPVLIEGEWSIAVLLPIDQQVLDSTRRFFDIDGAALVRVPVEAPETVAVLS
jgi:acyl-homoserine lactone synthase